MTSVKIQTSFFVCLFLAFSLSAYAFTGGDTIIIEYGNRYLTATSRNNTTAVLSSVDDLNAGAQNTRENALWVVESMPASGNYRFYNLGLHKSLGVKFYLGYESSRNSSAVVVSTLDVRENIYIWQADNNTDVSAEIYCVKNRQRHYIDIEYSWWWGTTIDLTTYKRTHSTHIYHFNHDYEEAVYDQTDRRVLSYTPEGHSLCQLTWESQTKTLVVPYRIKWIEVQYISATNDMKPINVSDIHACADDRTDCPSCRTAVIESWRWATGELQPVSISVSGREVTFTSEDKPMDTPWKSRNDTLLLSVRYDGVLYGLKVAVTQPTGRIDVVDSLDVQINPRSYEFENEAVCHDFTVEGSVWHGTVCRLSNGEERNNSVVRSDTVVTPIEEQTGIARKNLADNWTSEIVGNSIRVCVDKCPIQTNTPEAQLVYISIHNGVVHRTYADLLQKVNESPVSFNHQRGVTGRKWDERSMQGVHTVHYTIYAERRDKIALPVPENSFQGYWRWYDYDTDQKVQNGLAVTARINNDFGSFCTNTPLSDANASFTMPDNKVYRIGLDVSAYTDFTFTNGNRKIVEPTLSYRVIYEIRPANEMGSALAQCVGNKFLETYSMVTGTCNPIYLGPQYNFLSSGDFRNYYISKGTTLYRANEYRWKRNGTVIQNPTIAGNYLKVRETAVGTVDYTLEVRYYNKPRYGSATETPWVNVARFTVDFQRCDNDATTLGVGPVQERNGIAIISNADLDSKYILLAKQDFDYEKPGTSSFKAYNKPLEWDEATYGFTYTSATNPPYNRQVKELFPYWGEYMFINTTKTSPGASWLQPADNRSGAANGYMLYCDGTSMAGTVVSLDLHTQLCAGSRMFCSAWINSAGEGQPPVFQFQLIGLDADGGEHPLTTYTTGEIADNLGWQQILFSVQSDGDYDNYRMRITNHCATAAGNDFLIDDIRIYGSAPAISATQATAVCQSNDDHTITSLSRVDFQSLAGIDWAGAPLYMQWYNETLGSVMTHIDYVNKDADGTCGHIVLPLGDADIEARYADKIYASSDDLLAVHTASGTSSDMGFVKETDDYGQSHYVLYLAENINCGSDTTITLRLAFSKAELSRALCAMKHTLTVVPRVQLLLDGMPLSDNKVERICGTRKYNLSVRVYENENQWSTCKSDWLRGSPADSTDHSNIAHYGYTWPHILAAIADLRQMYLQPTGADNPNLSVSSVDAIRREYLTNDTVDSYTVISSLVSRGLLELGSEQIDLYMPDVATDLDLVRTVIPINGTSPAGYAVCNEPVKAMFELCSSGTYKLSLGRRDEVAKPAGGYIRGVRVAKDFSEFELSVDTSYLVEIDTVSLIESSDPDFMSKDATHCVLIPNVKDFISWNASKSTLKMVVDKKNSNITLKQGYSYTFAINLIDVFKRDTISDSESSIKCPIGVTYFKVLVVPDTVCWSPVGNSHSWNNDKNWAMTDAAGNEIRGGFVPQAHTNVIIPDLGELGAYPKLHVSQQVGDKQYLPVDSGAQQYISYDFNYAVNACRNIHFKPHAQLGNQHMLSYDKAWVEMPLPTQRWQMMAFPLNGVVAGDLYVPLDNYASATPFSAGQTCNGRHPYDFWQSLYNKSATKKTEANVDVDVTSVQWGSPTNAVTYPYPVGSGGAFWCYYANDLSVDELVVRLPKADTEYSYYKNGVGFFSELVWRTPDYGRLGFVPTMGTDTVMTVVLTNNAEGKLFVVGNPAMSGFNLKRFLDENSDVLSGTFYYIPDAPNSDMLSMEACTKYTATRTELVLPPFRAVLAETKAAAKSVEVKFTPSMFRLLGEWNSDFDAVIPFYAPAYRGLTRGANGRTDVSLARITAQMGDYYSTLFVGETAEASDAFEAGEDAELIVFADNTVETSSAHATIYAKNDGRALTIDILNRLNSVPLACHVPKKRDNPEQFALWFEGISSFSDGLQLFDEQTQTVIPLFDGMMLRLESAPSDETRYYLQRRGYSPDRPDDPTAVALPETGGDVAVYVESGHRVVAVADATIKSVAVYNVAGQKVNELNNIFQKTAEMELPQGIYLLNIAMQAGDKAVRKVVVR